MDEAFEKEIHELEAEVKNLRAERDKCLNERNSSKITDIQYARYACLADEKERLERDISQIKRRGEYSDGCEHEDQ
jgi:hypothetical protein